MPDDSLRPDAERGPRRRGPSPILIPDGPKPGGPGGLRGWLRNLRRSSPETLSPSPPAPLPPALPEAPADTIFPADPPVHRATVQMLPGRLEPLNPDVIQQEVRFQRTAAGGQSVTLGWEMEDPPGHVTLDHPSIQPFHARMTFQSGNWMIESLVSEDPVAINGSPLPTSEGPYLLADGDEIRIGPVQFRFLLT